MDPTGRSFRYENLFGKQSARNIAGTRFYKDLSGVTFFQSHITRIALYGKTARGNNIFERYRARIAFRKEICTRSIRQFYCSCICFNVDIF